MDGQGDGGPDGRAALQAALDLSPVPLGTAVDGRWTAVNDALCRLLGRPREDLVGVSKDVALHDDERGLRAVRPDGTSVRVRRTRSLLPDGAVALRLEDLDAEAGAEERRRTTQELVDSTDTLLFVKDAQGVYLQVNAAFARVVGRTPDACRGATDLDLFPPSVAAVYQRNDRDVVTTGERHDRLVGVPDPDRGMRTFRASKRALRDADGRVWGIAGVGADLTDEVRGREALERANADLVLARDEAERHAALVDAVLDTVDVGVVACDAAGRLTLVNRAARELYGDVAPAGVPAERWAERYALFEEDGVTPLPADEVPLRRALADGEVRDAVVVIAPPGLPTRTLECDGLAMRDAGGRLLGAVVALHDRTDARARARELVDAHDRALAATRAKSAFLASVSHEVRTPLYGMLGMLEVLLGGPLSPAQADRADIALRSGRTLLALLDDVLDLSKGEVAPLELHPRPVDVAALAADVVASARGSAGLKGLAVELETGPGLPAAVEVDPDRLRQVLGNLVGNAVKFTTDGAVRLTVAPDGPGSLLLRVADTGPGMDPAEQGRLFTPFEQGAAGRRHGGTGLGLALCRQLVELMGGTIAVRSGTGGSTFTVRLPAPEAAPVEVPAPRAAPVAGAPLTVLLVDDSEVNRLVGQALLEQLGARVDLADGGEQALAAVARTAYDLVLMDRQMPGLDGLETTRALRATPEGRGLHVVALTAGGEDQRQECLDAGMDGFLTKPVDLARLGALLQELPVRRAP